LPELRQDNLGYNGGMVTTIDLSRIQIAMLAAALLLWRPGPAVCVDARLQGVKTFALALGMELDAQSVEQLAAYDLVVIDGEGASALDVQTLRARGTLVLGYLSVGTIERGRRWYRRLKPYRLELWSDWGEWYAAVDQSGFRRIMARRIAPGLLKKGFDGLFLDNVDMIESHARQRRGMYALVRRLSRLAHGQARLLFAQNGDDVIAPIAAELDGWNREDVTLSYDFENSSYVTVSPDDTAKALETLSRLGGAGVFVTTTDYCGVCDPALTEAALANACGVGAVPFIADIGLSRLPPQPYRCLP
jgi:polysaccharide biosynthesis protein PelA